MGPAWTLRNPGVTAPLIGARPSAQLEDDLGALEVDFTASQPARLDGAGAVDLGYPHAALAGEHMRNTTAGGLTTETRR
ncbi:MULTISPECIES: hypothetical protein [Streptomyces]|uniref:hypothetical protein n=1 Tax=Streptomyces TaxID=1883 RepID=UPI000A9DA429|nr:MULTISPECIES: hypothetical protein [Streptomyces]